MARSKPILPFADDDDYDSGSGIPTTNIYSDNTVPVLSTLLPTLESITHVSKYILPSSDDDDYDLFSRISTTNIYSDNNIPALSTLLPTLESTTLESITHMLNFNISTTENSLHNLTGVKGANVQFRLYDVLIPTIGIIILLMNLAVVISSGLILKGGAYPRTTYLFLGNVAMADLVTGVATLFGQLFSGDSRTEMICIIQMGMIVSSTLASIWSVLLIGIDRFIYIVYALKYKKLTSLHARLLILFTWILGLIIGFMPITGWIGDTNRGRYCWFIKLAPAELVLLTVIVGCFPIFIITVLYSIILYYALRKMNQLKRADYEASTKQVPNQESTQQLRMFRGGQSVHDNNAETKKRNSPKKFRAVMVVGLTTGSFIITWVPYLIASMLYVFCMKSTNNQDDCKALGLLIAAPLAILGFMNSLLNPLIYAWWHKGFRTFVCTKILRRKPQKKPGTFSSDRRATTSSNKTTGSSYQSDSSRPTSPRINTGVTEGPFIPENEDTRL